MEILKNILDIIRQYEAVTALGIIPPFVLGLWTILFHLWAKNKELKHQRFLAYHELIKKLVDRDNPEDKMRLDRQIAIIFELRNFEEHHEVTIRILEGLQDNDDWKEHVRLMSEIAHTIKHCKVGYIVKIWRKIRLWHC